MTATRSFIIAAGLAVLAIIAAIVFIVIRPGGEPKDPTRDEPALTEAAPESETEAPAPALISPPTFDQVRVDPRGAAVMSGRGEPGATIQLLADEEPLFFEIDQPGGTAPIRTDRVEIDERGQWVIILLDPLPTGSIQLSLLMEIDGQQVRSEQTVVVQIPEARDATPLVVIGRPGQASRVEQGPLEGVEMGPLILSTVDYDENGAVIFSGRAEIGSDVRIFANSALVGETRTGRDGRWTLAAGSNLASGVYDLQIDQIDENGQVTAVIALPFERIAAEDVVLGPGSVVVQPGNSLWRIARRLYGEGVQYTVIYEANLDQIRDPDLIYPGQILNTPDEPDQGRLD
jgi:nucleoid-associated protein YgaU